MHTSARLSRTVLWPLAAVAMSVASLLTVTTAQAHQPQSVTSWHGPAAVTCYTGATFNVKVSPSFEKIGYRVAQHRAYKTWFQNIATGQWYIAQNAKTRDGWRYLPYESADSQAIMEADWWPTNPSNYYVVLDYAWNLGSGWSADRTWTGSYMISSGDFHGHPESTCRTKPILTTVTGCNGFGGLMACASSARTATRPPGARRGKLVPVRRHALTPPGDGSSRPPSR